MHCILLAIVEIQVEFAKDRNLAGVMVWSIEQDNDFRVNCSNAPNIINYIHEVQDM